MRAGGEALSLLAAPLNVDLLEALDDGPLSVADLQRAVGLPPMSTIRVYCRALAAIGALDSKGQGSSPGAIEYSITDAGRGLLAVGQVLERWLRESPEGPISPGTTASKSATKALIEGWSTTVVRVLAGKPLSLTDLSRLIPRINYPSLERRLGALRRTGLIEVCPGEGRGKPYRATPWLRRAIVPLFAAASWERRYMADPPPIGPLDIEAAFLLAAPLVDLPADLSGTCRLAVEVQGGSSPVFAGARILIEEGKVVSCSSRLEGDVDARISGTLGTWLRSMRGTLDTGMTVTGDSSMAKKVLEGLQRIAADRVPAATR